MSPDPKQRCASGSPANDNVEQLTHAEMKADLEKAGIGHLIKQLIADYPKLSEEMAIEHLHSFLLDARSGNERGLA
jgi:hypothetical protein